MSAIVKHRRSHVLAAVLAVGLLPACAGQDDIDRTQLDKVDKAIFVNADGTPRTFYYRKTTTGVPPTSAYAFEGIMGELMKVRFSIEEDLLVAHRAFDYAPGSQNPFTGGDNNDDTPPLIFKIESHFDVKREYNAGTGEETNVIVENTTDRDWNQRQFMRVDWSHNLAEQSTAFSFADPMNPFFPATTLDTGFFIGEGENALINPNRPIIRKDYVDFTTKEFRTPDYNACLRLFDTWDDGGPWSCGPAEITYRNSLLPVPTSEYEPLSFPDREVLVGDDGKPIRYAYDPNVVWSDPNDPTGLKKVVGKYVECTPAALAAAGLSGDDCSEAAMDQFSKFGFFRTVRPTYNRQTGAVEEGRQYLANRWNIWQETIEKDGKGVPMLDANGNPVRKAIKDRTPRKIVYYLNPEFPDDTALIDEAKNVIDHWNQAMKETVAGLKFPFESRNAGKVPTITRLRSDAADMPTIFELQPNGCSLANVNDYVMKHPDVARMVSNRVSSERLDLEAVDKAHLLQACSALSAVTENLNDGDPKKFVWQRNGDLRYSFLYWVDRPQPGGPLGYGPSSQDPETGEIISASAYIYGASLDVYAKFAADSVQLVNGNLDPDDLLSGKTISDVLRETKAMSQARQQRKLSPEASQAMSDKLRSLGRTREQRMVKVAAGIDDQMISRLKGTPLEKLLLNDDVLPGLLPGYKPGDTPPADAFERAMANPWFSSQAAEARRDKFQKLAMGGCLYMAEFADDAILGTAIEMSMLPPAELFKQLRVAIFRGLADHEVGHTMGLRHNFSSSTDAFNYNDKFWQIRGSGLSEQKQEEMKLSEYAYASVMDYGSRFNSDVQGLGKYDTAAIRFGYGQLIDLVSNADNAGSLSSVIFYDDYSGLPKFVGGVDKMDSAATTVVSYAGSVKSMRDQFKDVKNNGGFFLVFPERPYKFCGDEFEGNFDCKTWDRGANQREIVGNVDDQFRNYHVFNAYKRGRTSWEIGDYLNRLESRYFNRYQQAFQFFYFFGDALDGTGLGDDMKLASIDALNSIGAVLQTPEPGVHCLTAYSPDVLTVPVLPADCLAASPKPVLNLPDAKPFFINFSDDYYYRITRTGSLYEKLEALFTLTSTESRFFRVDTFADSNRFSINFYRMFRDEMVRLLSGIIRDDSSAYGATYRIPAGGTTPTVVPTPVVDPDMYGIADPPPPPYSGLKRLETPVNKTIRFWALVLSLTRLGSTWDTTLDFQNFLAVAVKGADDDFTLGSSVTIKEFTHPTTGVIYRAPAYAPPSPNNIGAEIIDELTAIVGSPGVQGSIPIRFGGYTNGQAYPNWYTAKAAMELAFNQQQQQQYKDAKLMFEYIDYLVNYRIDLISDIRVVRRQMQLLAGGAL
jgi:hypothetical protein